MVFGIEGIFAEANKENTQNDIDPLSLVYLQWSPVKVANEETIIATWFENHYL